MGVWIGTKIGLSINRFESLLGGITVNAAGFDLVADQVSHQHDACLKGSGHNHGRSIDSRMLSHQDIFCLSYPTFAATLLGDTPLSSRCARSDLANATA
jgi:hypothetical protein